MERLFGTDGVRGIPGKPPLTPETLRRIAAIAARLLYERGRSAVNGRGPFILIGRDTRQSGPALMESLVAGFADAGVRALDLGVAPTPAVSYLVRPVNALGGAVISASHNPAEFNGVKFFDRAGFKMDPGTEDAIEAELRRAAARRRSPAPLPVARPEDGSALSGLYLDYLRSTFPATLDLAGLTLVVDCANGASSAFAPRLFAALGANVVALSCQPDGRNINLNCGALFSQAMRQAVIRHGADAGVSFDGDADRAIFADERGELLDGDSLICVGALRLHQQGLLRNDRVVLTVMSNIGLVNSLRAHGIGVVSVPVGDRNVTEAIEREGLSIGGESSGHVIFRRFAVTGDGMLTALQTLAALRESGKPLSAARKAFRAVPQALRNIHCDKKPPLDRLRELRRVLARCEKELDGDGRVLLRYSGTEPLLRIMVEGPSRSRVIAMAKSLAAAYRVASQNYRIP